MHPRHPSAAATTGLALLGAFMLVLAPTVAGADSATHWHDSLLWQGRNISVTTESLGMGLRRFVLRSNDATDASAERVVSEDASRPRVQTGNPLFDALYALALEEARQDSVEQITDAQFNDGQPIPCSCFETGAKWHYVWTRDISYATDLGLAMLDPERARNSLYFKQSGLRAGPMAGRTPAASVVAQDTGSGGSWPISTDRVIWIHAATDVVDALPAQAAAGMRAQVLRTASATLEQDRRFAFDADAGLYRGETSFLDWREQNYPAWTRTDTRFIAEGFALSTNVAHYVALLDAARLARHAHSPDAGRFSRQAATLRDAIRHHFWNQRSGLYASYLSRDLAPAESYDLLGISLAVIHGIVDAPTARQLLARYPVTAAGPPVIWPEQSGIAIYHNRAIWPFVTAYALQAASVANDPEHMSAYAESIIRGAALNLSNYENQEFLTQQTTFQDGALTGPVINSPRQLWSVAAYLGMVARDLFGVHVGAGGTVRVEPAIPGGLAHRLFGAGRELRLDGLVVGGRPVGITLTLPAQWSDTDMLRTVDDTVADRASRTRRTLPPGPAHVHLSLVAMPSESSALKLVRAADPHALTPGEQRELFAPPPPTLVLQRGADEVVVLQATGVPDGNAWHLQRDGVEIQTAGSGEPLRERRDPRHTLCYTATQSWPERGHRSLPSPEVCVPALQGVRHYVATDSGLRLAAAQAPERNDTSVVYRNWGAAQERLEFSDTSSVEGPQRLRVTYGNGYGPVNTGITAAVKAVTVTCPARATQVGTVVMAHRDPADPVGASTAFVYRAPKGSACHVVIADGTNMTDLEHFALYTGGRGGRQGPWNRADIYGVTVDPLDPGAQLRARLRHPPKY